MNTNILTSGTSGTSWCHEGKNGRHSRTRLSDRSNYRRVLWVENDVTVQASEPGDAVLKAKDVHAFDLINPEMVWLPQDSDENAAIIIFEDALWKYARKNIFSNQKMTHTFEERKSPLRADIFDTDLPGNLQREVGNWFWPRNLHKSKYISDSASF